MERLSRAGIRPIYVPKEGGGRLLSHLEAMTDTHIGLKLWSYIGALNLKVVRL